MKAFLLRQPRHPYPFREPVYAVITASSFKKAVASVQGIIVRKDIDENTCGGESSFGPTNKYSLIKIPVSSIKDLGIKRLMCEISLSVETKDHVECELHEFPLISTT